MKPNQITCSVTCMLLRVSKLGRCETRNGIQSPPKATGFPSSETSISETASASDDISSTLGKKQLLVKLSILEKNS